MAVTLAAVEEAQARIAGSIVTPVMTCSHIDSLCGRSVFFKCENFQKTGSFKARRALCRDAIADGASLSARLQAAVACVY
jgi:threonine dehydratase